MTRLDTDPMTPGLRTGQGQADGLPWLIRVPRMDEPRERVRSWRPESASRCRPTWRGSAGSSRAAGRPRRRLRRGVRRAGSSLLVLAAMAGTFAMGWTTGGGSPRVPLLGTVALGRAAAELAPTLIAGERLSDARPAVEDAEAGAVAAGPDLGAPIADAEVPVVFPGYLLPDNNREEAAHEGS